jgi:CRISPR-associated protein Csm2
MAQAPNHPRPQQHQQAAPQPSGHDWRARIRFTKPLDPELFSTIAKNAAQRIAQGGSRFNKSSQLRRFYDELCMWEEKTAREPEKFAEYLPFIRMLNAKAAYAEGRGLVNRDFVSLLQHTLMEANSAETLTICKYFWEAFMGFYKQERQD